MKAKRPIGRPPKGVTRPCRKPYRWRLDTTVVAAVEAEAEARRMPVADLIEHTLREAFAGSTPDPEEP